MRQLLPWLLFVTLGVGAFLLLRAPRPDVGEDDWECGSETYLEPARPGGAGEGLTAAPGVELSPGTAPRVPRTGPDPRTPEVLHPSALPRGSIEVFVLGPDDQPLAPDELRVDVEPGRGQRAWPAPPLPLPDPETGAWKASEIYAGPVLVRVRGDHVVETVTEATVAAGASTSLRVHVDLAGSIEYSVKAWDDSVPEQVKLTLLGEGRRPVLVSYQVRTPTVLTTAQRLKEATQGPDGVIFGIPPGRYLLRVTSPNDEVEETSVEIEVGKTLTLPVKVRR